MRHRSSSRRLPGVTLNNGRVRGSIEPRPVDCPIIRHGFTPRQHSPDFDDGLCLPQVFHESIFGMVTSPPAAFIKLNQKIEPLFGKYTPAIEDILSVVGRTPGIVSLSHWGTVRREGNGRRRNERIIQACGIFCGKPVRSPALCGVNMTPLWKQSTGRVLQAASQTARRCYVAGSQTCDRNKLCSLRR